MVFFTLKDTCVGLIDVMAASCLHDTWLLYQDVLSSNNIKSVQVEVLDVCGFPLGNGQIMPLSLGVTLYPLSTKTVLFVP